MVGGIGRSARSRGYPGGEVARRLESAGSGLVTFVRGVCQGRHLGPSFLAGAPTVLNRVGSDAPRSIVRRARCGL